MQQGSLLKKTVDAIKDLVTEANLEVSSAGMQMQAMVGRGTRRAGVWGESSGRGRVGRGACLRRRQEARIQRLRLAETGPALAI